MSSEPETAQSSQAERKTAPAGAPASLWLEEIVPFGVFTTDQELRISSWNRWLVERSGRAVTDVLGRSLWDVYPELGERQQKRFLRALDGEVSIMSAALHKYLLPLPVAATEAAGPYMLQTARIAPLMADGVTVGTITIIEDVTQREVQAAILHRQQELDRLLSEALGALLRSTDPASDVTEIFPILMPSLGLDTYFSYLMGTRQTALHLNAAGGISPAQRDAMAVLPVWDGPVPNFGREDPIPATIAAHEKMLATFGVRAHCCFPLRVGVRVIGLLSFGSYQREVLPASDVNVLARIAQYLALALDRAMRERDIIAASRAKDDFLAALSHELRTPLNPVLLLAGDSAGNPAYPEDVREVFRVIEKNALLEARLIDDLLDLTRIEHGKTSLENQLVDVHETLSDALVTIRGDAASGQLALHVEMQAEASLVRGDSARLQQVFWNLLKNAVKFTPAGGRITVQTFVDTPARTIVVRVTDTGIGIAGDDVERIFGAFVQGRQGESDRAHRFGGLGLGLAISRKLVELHSGRIEATSEGSNRGSTFTVHLPLAPVLEVEGRSPVTRERLPLERAEEPAPCAGNILLVEDHEPTREPLTRLLTRRGYAVVAVASVRAAIEAAAAQPFDLVLSDIGLPDGDGFALMKVLRDRYQLKGIALTGYGMDEDIARSNEAGFIAHLTKPVRIAALDRTLAAAFTRVGG
jgi:signal transduction histidine kinase